MPFSARFPQLPDNLRPNKERDIRAMGAAKNLTNMVQPLAEPHFSPQGQSATPPTRPQLCWSPAPLPAAQSWPHMQTHPLAPSQPSLVLFLITVLMLGSRATFFAPTCPAPGQVGRAMLPMGACGSCKILSRSSVACLLPL